MRPWLAPKSAGQKRWLGYLIATIWALGTVALVIMTSTQVHTHVAVVAVVGVLIWTVLFLSLIRLTYKSELVDGIVSPIGIICARTGRRWELRPIVVLAYYAAVIFACHFLVRPVLHFVIKTGWGFFPSAVVTFVIVVGSFCLLHMAIGRRWVAGRIAMTRRLRDLLFSEVERGN